MTSKFYFLFFRFLLIILLSTFYFLFSLPSGFAAEISLDAKTREMAVGQQFQVDVFLDAQNEEINAVEGKIVFPKNLLEAKEILDGGSMINLWIEKPNIMRIARSQEKNKNEIFFSGIIPGGFKGVLSPFYEGYRPGKILSLIFKANAIGEGSIDLKETKVLLNDGLGTSIAVSVLPFQFRITSKAPAVTELFQINDSGSPELFEPIVARDPDIFEGKWFLVFATQDKGLGIDHYQVLENINQKIKGKKWVVAESPYLLKDQKLKSYIYVKAVDKSGNERVVVLPPKNRLYWYENYLILITIILGIIITAISGKILWKKLKK